MLELVSFGEWIRQRRKDRRLTQRELAANAACAVATIKKIEADERRPSAELAAMLGGALAVPPDWQERFIACARGQRMVSILDAMVAATQPAAAPTSALPVPAKLLIGRDTELDEITERLNQPECRLLTLVGPGGIGKTRLSLELAYRLHDSFESGVVFVPLAGIASGDLVPSAILQTLNLAGADDTQLFAYLSSQKMLIVFDNCEQLGDGVAWFSMLLSRVPNIKLVATSRERLQLVEEWVYEVPELDRNHAVKLFMQSAVKTHRGTAFRDDSDDISTICDLVANLPLAIELAAGWLTAMTPAQIAANIQQDIDFLATNVRNVPERHRSIRAVFDHSWQLLTMLEKQALMRLSVFRGGWTADTAETVAQASLPLLRAFIEKSLIRTVNDQRFDLHELTRQYVADKLRESGREADTFRDHIDALADVAMQIYVMATGEQALEAFRRGDEEIDNFRAAVEHAAAIGETAKGFRLLDNLFFYMLRRGHWQEIEQWHRLMQDAAGEEDSEGHCISLLQRATFMAIQGRYAEALPVGNFASDMAQRINAPNAFMVLCESQMQAVPTMEQATEMFEKAEFYMKQWDHPSREARLAGLYGLYGDRLRTAGRNDEAVEFYRLSLDIYRSLNNVDMIAYPLGNLGRIALDAGNLGEAHTRFAESVQISRRVGNRVGIADWLRQLGRALFELGDAEQAEACFEETLALYEEVGNTRAMPDMIAWLGRVALYRGETERATSFFRDSLIHYRQYVQQIDDFNTDWGIPLTWDLIHCLLMVILFALRNGDTSRALTQFATTQIMRDDIRFGQPDRSLLQDVEAEISAVRSQLTAEEIKIAEQSARDMSVLEFLDYALATVT